jgi:hypothetical protein
MVGIFNGHLEYFITTWYILWPFANFVATWRIFHRLGTLCKEKSGSPALQAAPNPMASITYIICSYIR